MATVNKFAADGAHATPMVNHKQNQTKPDGTQPFNFPFPPYDIQVKLMRVAYDTFEQSKFALLESPTGTGKSLSIICSSLSWLRDHQKRTRFELTERKEGLSRNIDQMKREESESGDWLSVQTKRQEASRELANLCKRLERLDKFDERNEARRHARLHGLSLEQYAAFSTKDNDPNKNIGDGPLNETRDTNILGGASQESNKSGTNQDGEDMDKKVAQQVDDHVKPKVYYASRTHSQLSQFINELKRTKFAQLNSVDEPPPIKVAALASRANLCVNIEVLKLKEASAINERCMEMQKETASEKRCPYIKAKDVNGLKEDILSSVYDIEDLVSRGRAKGACPYYASRMAIPEAELVVLPYNNLLHRETRQASSLDLKDNIVIIDEAHNILETICSIHSAPITGLQLIGCHNVFSRYYNKYGSRMSPRNAQVIKTIVQCLTAIIRYLNDPRKHLKYYECPKAVDIEESVIETNDDGPTLNAKGKICKSIPAHEEFMLDITKFVGASNMDRFNVYKIIDYLNRSQLPRKLIGFFRSNNSVNLSLELSEVSTPDAKAAQQTGQSAPTPRLDDSDLKPQRKRKKMQPASETKTNKSTTPRKLSSSLAWQCTRLDFLPVAQSGLHKKNDPVLQSYPIYFLMEFFRSLTNLHDDGKILTDFHERDIMKSSLKFLLLNPASQFKMMVEEARSIVLAGGTMQPFDEFLQLLFGPLGVNEERITLFSCGHVISPNNLFMASLINGPTYKPLELSFKMKNSFDTIDEIGRTIMNISFIAPGGMVCFLPSYEYLHICYTRWSQLGLISKIETRSKRVFREPRQASQLKPVFDQYVNEIRTGKANGRGSLLFCVVGGKMSEGINFNDDLGRCVVMVGLPYANIKSGELQEKMRYYDKTCKRSPVASDPSPGQKYYENLCVKGINQSIGRAIRHKSDHASVILLDRRYQTKGSIKSGLPGWMRQSLAEHERFGSLFSQLKAFYNRIKDTTSQVG